MDSTLLSAMVHLGVDRAVLCLRPTEIPLCVDGHKERKISVSLSLKEKDRSLEYYVQFYFILAWFGLLFLWFELRIALLKKVYEHNLVQSNALW